MSEYLFVTEYARVELPSLFEVVRLHDEFAMFVIGGLGGVAAAKGRAPDATGIRTKSARVKSSSS